MKKLMFPSIILLISATMIVACGRDMRALKRSSKTNITNTVNGNLQLASDLESAATGLAGQHFAGLFNNQNKIDLHNRLRAELGGIDLSITKMNNGNYAIVVALAEQGCRNRATVQSSVDPSRLGNRNFAIDVGSSNGYSVNMVCLPSNMNGQTACNHYLMSVSKDYGNGNRGSVVTIMGFDPAQKQYVSVATQKPINYYAIIPRISQVCSQAPSTNNNGNVGVGTQQPNTGNVGVGTQQPNTGNVGVGTQQPATGDYSYFDDIFGGFDDIVPADPSGDVSVNPFLIDYSTGTSTTGSDTAQNPFVNTTDSSSGQNTGGAPFETTPVTGDETFPFFDTF